ncbi:MAG: hypothetical protein QM831_43060 [Kofleriaceae bacterium]
MRLVLALTFASSLTAAAPPKNCAVSFRLPDAQKEVVVRGPVKSIQHITKDLPHWLVTVEDKAFDVYADALPFKEKQTIDVRIVRGPAFQILFDGIIKDASGHTQMISSDSGSLDLADGWTVKMGAVFESRQDPNQKQQSVDRTMGLDFTRGTTKFSVKPGVCAEVKDGDVTWLVTGAGHSWLGVRPPEGVDYQMFALTRM